MKMKAQNALLPVFLFLSFFSMTSKAQNRTIETERSVADSLNNFTRKTSLDKKSETTYNIEAFGSASIAGDNTPFWLQHHNWGIVPFEAGNYYARAGAAHKQKVGQNVSFELGVDLVTSSKQDYIDSFWLQQAYGKVKWKSLQMSVGINENYRSVIADPFLSLGDMISSNNARPNPEVRLSIPEFTPIPLTGKNVYIKGDLGFGYFLDDSYYEKIVETSKQNYTTGTRSHSKSLYLYHLHMR